MILYTIADILKFLPINKKLKFAYLLTISQAKVQGPSLQEVCVFTLLFSEAGRSLLDIVTTGVDSIQQALAQQCT